MTIHRRASGAWAQVTEVHRRTGGAWAKVNNVYRRVSGAWTEVPIVDGTQCVFSTLGGQFVSELFYGYKRTTFGPALGGLSAMGTMAANTHQGYNILELLWTATEFRLTLGAASLGASFITSVEHVGGLTKTTFTYSTGTGYSSWACSWASLPISGTPTFIIV